MLQQQVNHDIKHLYGVIESSAGGHADAELSEYRNNHSVIVVYVMFTVFSNRRWKIATAATLHSD